jgi:hypothetical protein
MRRALVWMGIAALGVGGCATTSRGAGSQTLALARGEESGMRVGETRVLDAHVNPMVPVHLATEGGVVAVTFGQAGRGVVAWVDPSSLQLLSRQPAGRSEGPSAPSTEPTRVLLDGGRFLVCWTRQGSDGGRHAVVRLWTRNGSPVGEPLVISPSDDEVFGSPSAMSIDGRHVVVTFTATSGNAFELRAVSLEDTQSRGARGDSERTARR